MNTRTIRTATLAAALVGTLAGGGAIAWAASAPSGTHIEGAGVTASSASADLLRFSREEERLARDLYAALAAAHDGARPMSMITRSEQQHYSAVGALLATYHVPDPSNGLGAGTYAFPELQRLYDDWLARGRTTLAAAYQVGVELEQRDIADLERALGTSTPTDVKTVLTNLLGGSRRHLAAYQRAASGVTAGGPGRQVAGDQGMRRGGQGRPGSAYAPGRGPGHDSGLGANADCPMAQTARS
ncbi:MAG: DUF2202 domain-containing protein [Dermatophilaceae bacterium]